MEIANMRNEYAREELSEADMDADPIRQFAAWFQEALAAKLPDANAMTLATATPDGQPSARMVLLKAFDNSGFTFHTNYNSRKGRELTANPRAALLFFWPQFHRQVRIEGTVERVSAVESDEYFRSRPLGSQLGAWASRQSDVIRGREALEESVREITRRFADVEAPRPPFWGGFRVRPLSIEFWQGRPDRLHDRLRYRRVPPDSWRIERLAP